MRPRKRGGTTACSKKAQVAETVCGAEGHGKTCTAKAILLEPQFAATNTRRGAAERLTQHIGQSGGAMFTPPAGHRFCVETLGEPACDHKLATIRVLSVSCSKAVRESRAL